MAAEAPVLPDMTAAEAPNPTLSRFDGRMTDWRNDDLLFTQPQRDLIDAEFPGAVAVFDFPELRAHFGGFDAEANLSRRRRQRRGLTVILMAGLGATLSALMPLVDLFGLGISRWVLLVSAIVSAIGLVWGALLILSDPSKERWLDYRLRTERLRQFHFQLLLSAPDLAARAMRDPAALVDWQAHRRAALRHFEAWLAKPPRAEVAAVMEDVNHRRAWFADAWSRFPTLDGTVDLTDYLAIMRRQRIEVQLAYVHDKLAPGIGSPETRLRLTQWLSWCMTIGTVVLSCLFALLIFRGLPDHTFVHAGLVSLIALVGVFSIIVRVVAEGYHLRGDRDRYTWYRDAIEEVDAQFRDPNPLVRIATLREMEEISYREMREFLKAHDEARFNFA
jgi:hypothetical protein